MADTENSNRVRKDPEFYAETLVQVNTENGAVIVASKFDDKYSKMTAYVAPETGNKAAFHRIDNSYRIGEYIQTFNRAHPAPEGKDYPYKFYKVPVDEVSEFANLVMRSRAEPGNDIFRSDVEKYRTYPTSLKRIKFETKALPWESLAAMGISYNTLGRVDLGLLQEGRMTEKLYKISTRVGSGFNVDIEGALQAYRNNEDKVMLRPMTPLAEKWHGMGFSRAEAEALDAGRPIGRAVLLKNEETGGYEYSFA